MKNVILVAALIACTSIAAPLKKPLASSAEIDAAERAPLDAFSKANDWNEPAEPFTAYANVHYVGTKTISAWLITTHKGHFMIDGAVPQSAPQILANIKKLGFNPRDIRFLLNSHAHIDHAGGLAGIERASGATMVASAADKPILEAGDIWFGPSKGMAFPRIRVTKVVKDGEVLGLGGVKLTAHLTPGHTPGCTSWSMKAKGKDGVERTILFHCSATVAGQQLVPESWPGMVATYRSSFAKVRALKADIFLANHDNFFDLDKKRAKLKAGDANAFVDPSELGRFNALMESAFEKELAAQTEAHAKAGAF